MSFPNERPRRLRSRPALRRLARETQIAPQDLIYPLFVRDAIDEPQSIEAMPGHYQHTIDSLTREAEAAIKVGARSLVLFGIPAHKDAEGSNAWDDDGIVQRALRQLRDAFGPDVLLIADLCLCEYTDHGHCGVLDGETVASDRTLEIYQRIAVTQAAAGADVIAPSGMMDGQVGAIRSALDRGGFTDRAILAYAAKYASAFYGPLREAAGSAPSFGDRRGYQMDPGNAREAVREARLDVEEGADIVMVKPALAFLDVIRAVADSTEVPVAAYNVSGEYAMVKAAAMRGWIDERRVLREILLGIRRAGAQMVLTYHAKEVAADMPCWDEQSLPAGPADAGDARHSRGRYDCVLSLCGTQCRRQPRHRSHSNPKHEHRKELQRAAADDDQHGPPLPGHHGDEQGHHHPSPRSEARAQDREQLRFPGERPFLRRAQVSPRRRGFRDPGRRPAGHRVGWTRLQVQRRTGPGRVHRRRGGHGQLGAQHERQPVLHLHRRRHEGSGQELQPVWLRSERHGRRPQDRTGRHDDVRNRAGTDELVSTSLKGGGVRSRV